MSDTDWLRSARCAARHRVVRAGALLAALSVLTLVACAALWWLAARSHDRQLQAIDAERRRVVLARQADEVTAAYRLASAQIASIDNRLAHTTGQADVVASLARLAQRSGIRVDSEAYEESKSGELVLLAAQLSLQGSYSALRDFLLGLSDLPVWVEVHELRFERVRDGDGLIKAQLRLAVFRNDGKSSKDGKGTPAKPEGRRS
jgi:Tfp pilus assembly protein PilO